MAPKSRQAKNRKRGRPPSGLGTPVQVRVKDEQLAAIDAWRRAQPDLPNRPEALRRLAEIGIKASLRKARP